MINIDITGSYHKPFWFPFASVYVPVTPCVLDGSLSFLEMVWKLLRDLNKTIEATNANHTDILTLVDEIDKLYGSKLSYIVVNFTHPNPMLAEITADTEYTDIVKAYAEGIVLGQFNGDLYIALGYDSDDKVVSFYSLNEVNLRRIKDNENRISYYNEEIITNNGGTITGTLNLTRTPTDGNEAANKKYVDNQDAITLKNAKTYTDQNFVRTNGNSGRTYASRNITEMEFTNIPTAPDTITITALLEKLARWYEEIKNKITRATLTVDHDVYSCDKTFAEMYELITDGQEVQITFNDPLLSNVGTSIMRLERYTTTTITFTGDNHTCTINNSNVITFS